MALYLYMETISTPAKCPFLPVEYSRVAFSAYTQTTLFYKRPLKSRILLISTG